MPKFKEVTAGDTIKFTFISSGDTFSPIFVDIRDGNETLVNSAPMVSSGSGLYYYNYTTPSTPGYYNGKMIAYINSLAYIRPEWFRVTPMEVD